MMGITSRSKSASTIPRPANEPRYRQLKLDYDTPGFPWATFTYGSEFITDNLGIRFTNVRRHKTRRGWHVTARLSRGVPAPALVALQAILGSDPRRETFNLLRALALDQAPGFWRTRWNVLYAKKLPITRESITMVSLAQYGGEKKPSLKAKDLGGADTAVLTVTRAQEVDVTREDGKGRSKVKHEAKAVVLEFRELPDNSYWPNNTSVRNLVAALGEDETRWIGKAVPLEVVSTTNPETKKPTKALWVAKPEDWKNIIRQYGGRFGGKRGARKAAKKAARR